MSKACMRILIKIGVKGKGLTYMQENMFNVNLLTSPSHIDLLTPPSLSPGET